MTRYVLDAIQAQIELARADLQEYKPREMDWRDRVAATAETLIPWMTSVSSDLKTYVEDVLNSPIQLRRMWSTIRDQLELPREQIEAFDHQLSKDDVLRESVTGEVISKVVTRFLIEKNLDLKSNGRSDYPDLYLLSADYSGLAVFKRKNDKGEIDFGAALKGKEKRPVRVPDGLEIKTCKNRIRVDCHHPHVGLHFVLVFKETARFFAVTDLAVAFLRPDDYYESRRNTAATTVKYSFNGDQFVSLFV